MKPEAVSSQLAWYSSGLGRREKEVGAQTCYAEYLLTSFDTGTVRYT